MTPVICLLIPTIDLNLGLFQGDHLPDLNVYGTIQAAIQEEDIIGNTEKVILNQQGQSTHFIWLVYLTICLVLCLRFCKNLYSILQLKKEAKEELIGGIKVLFIEQSSNPFSFLNWIFLNKESFYSNHNRMAILKHEMAHCAQYHSIDIILIEFICCLFWINPFTWLIKKSIRENHEFLADEGSLNQGLDKQVYGKTLLQMAGLKTQSLTSGFSYLQTKKRIKMMYKIKPKTMNTITRITTVVIISTLALSLFSIKGKFRKKKHIVIDVGHGGKDPGCSNGTHMEKDICLAISDELRKLSNDQVKFDFTRNGDEFLELKDRVEIINKLTPDFFISLHVNTSDHPDKNGVESYYYPENKFAKVSQMICSELIQNQLPLFDHGMIKSGGFYVLKNANCPGVILETGFISNEKDLQVLLGDASPAKIAEGIHNSVMEINL
jgi:N-acetylmuramoyl-L-alanine amidase